MQFRVEIRICDKPFFAVPDNALALLITLETATRGMKREDFAAFIKRIPIQIELWKTFDGNEKVVLCSGGHVLGDWI